MVEVVEVVDVVVVEGNGVYLSHRILLDFLILSQSMTC